MSREIKNQKDRACVKCLETLISDKSDMDFEDVGFCYWNISDCYALLRDCKRLCDNHKRFYCHCQTSDTKYLYWPLSDVTQRWTLEDGGLGDIWWSMYQDAVEKNGRGLYPQMEFEVHRAALMANSRMPIDQNRMLFVINNIDHFLTALRDKQEYDFYDLYYYTQKCAYAELDVEYLLDRCCPYLKMLGQEKTDRTKNFLCGEWESFQVQPSCLQKARLSINASINALIYKGHLFTARELYEQALEQGLGRNHYIEKRLEI